MPLDLEAIRKIVAAAPQQLESKSCWQCGAPREYHGGEHGKEHKFDSWSEHQPLIDAMAELVDEVDRLQSDRSMRMERLREELTWTEAALNALAFAAGVDFGTARADLERAAAGPEIDGVSGAYRYAASLVARAVDRAGRKAEAELRARCLPVVEWRHLPGSAGWERADVGQFSLLLMGDSAWRLICGDQAVIARGSPGGPAGKAACEAAYRRACGLPAPVAPQVVPLHQAYEGTTACLHCGKPQPWPEMDRCPRDSGIPAIPACAG